jgi:hypothetical protein
MGRFAIAICVVCLASGSSAIAQETNPAAQDAREVRIERTVSRLESGETNDGASRLAVRAALSSDLTQQEKLGLLLLMTANRRSD